jgi:hypothetical protein
MEHSGTLRNTVVHADVVRRLGRRRVELEVGVPDRVAATVRLVRHGDELVERSYGWLGRGRQTLHVAVPRGVHAGAAEVVVELADQAGNTRIARKAVAVPS